MGLILTVIVVLPLAGLMLFTAVVTTAASVRSTRPDCPSCGKQVRRRRGLCPRCGRRLAGERSEVRLRIV